MSRKRYQHSTTEARHFEGINFSIRRPNGEKYDLYANPYSDRHPHFEGTLCSRLFHGTPGKPCEVEVEFEPDYKPHKAGGMQVGIAVGGDSTQLERRDNLQVFWLDVNQMNIHKKHVFNGFKLWEDEDSLEPSREVPLEIPEPNGKTRGYDLI